MEIIENGITANIVGVLVSVYAYFYLKSIKNKDSKFFILGVIIIAASGIGGVVVAQLLWYSSSEFISANLGKNIVSNGIGLFQAIGLVFCIRAFKTSSENA